MHFLCPFHDYQLKLCALTAPHIHKKKLTVMGVVLGVNPYGKPDRKILDFFTPSLSTWQVYICREASMSKRISAKKQSVYQMFYFNMKIDRRLIYNVYQHNIVRHTNRMRGLLTIKAQSEDLFRDLPIQ